MRAWSDVFGLYRIPYLKQAVKGPFNALNAGLLVLQGIFVCKGLSGDRRPIVASMEVKKVEIGEQE